MILNPQESKPTPKLEDPNKINEDSNPTESRLFSQISNPSSKGFEDPEKKIL